MQQKLTSCKVHKAIQDIYIAFPDYNHAISIDAIAEVLHVAPGELSEHMNRLSDLYYIKFGSRANENIRLTDSGRYTIVPGLV